MPTKTALILLHEGVEEIECVTPIDILRRGGVDVTVAAVGDRLTVTGRSGIQIKADLLLIDALYSPQATWDLLVIPGGPGVDAVRKNPLVANALKRHKGRLIGAICAAPLALLDAGLITADGSTAPYTAHPATLAELPAAQASQSVVHATLVDAAHSAFPAPTRLITSRGAGTATAFALALLEQVVGGEAGSRLAAEVAESICLQAPQ